MNEQQDRVVDTSNVCSKTVHNSSDNAIPSIESSSSFPSVALKDEEISRKSPQEYLVSTDPAASSSSCSLLNSEDFIGIRHILPEALSHESLKRSFGSSISTLGEIPHGVDSLLVTATMNSALQEGDKDHTQYIGSTPSTPSRDSSNPYGWFSMESMDEKLEESKELRDAYIARTQFHLGHSNSGSSDSYSHDQNDPSVHWAAVSLDAYELQQISYDEIPEHSILFRWRNPNPSMTLKCSGNLLEKVAESVVGSTELLTSCFIGGYRTVQLSCGSIRAEFQFVFSYGSKSFSCWKPFTEFRKLHMIISHVHKSNYTFPKAVEEWYGLRSRQKWYRCLSVVYLIEKSVLLGRYMQALLMESDSPGLLLYFVQSKAIAQ